MVQRAHGEHRAKHALSAWRTAHVVLDEATLLRVRHAVFAAPLLHHRRWPPALRGDTAAAVAVAVDILATQGPRSFAADVAMSRLLLDAAGCDPAAELVLAHALRRLAASPDDDAKSAGARRGPLHTSSETRSRPA